MTQAAPVLRAAPAETRHLDPARRTEPLRALTGLRGAAAWWVVAYHFRDALPDGLAAPLHALIDRGYLAVDLFFVLSGYVIAVNYAGWFAPAEGAGGGRYARFLALRLSRIYPLHLAMLLLFLVAPLATLAVGHRAASGSLHPAYFLLSLGLVQGWGFVPGPEWNVPAWSISVEWLAYLAFPALARCQARLAGTQGRAALGLLGCAALLAGVAELRGPGQAFEDFQYFGVARCLLEFSMGLCVCRLLALRAGRERATAAGGLAAGCLAACCLAPGLEYTVLPLGFAALVYALATEAGVPARILRAPAMQWLGLVSYSTYMSHYLLKFWVKFALLRPGIPPLAAFWAYLCAVLAASAVLHASIERPGQRAARRWLAARGARTA